MSNPNPSTTTWRELLGSHLFSSSGTSSDKPSYWHESRRPFASFLFLIPFVVLYELGVHYAYQTKTIDLRNGADLWLRQLFSQIGFPIEYLLPALLTLILMLWHQIGRYQWRCRWETWMGMGSESLLFAFALLAMAQLQQSLMDGHMLYLDTSHDLPQTHATERLWMSAVTYLGAGLSEEVLFRLLMIPLLLSCLMMIRIPHHWALILSITIASMIFAVAHYVSPEDLISGSNVWLLMSSRLEESPSEPMGLIFRFLAGTVFGVLMLYRGIGITIGTHTSYDLLVGILINT